MPLAHHLIPCDGYWNYGPLSQCSRGTSLYPWTQLGLVSNAMLDLRRQLELIDHYMRRYGMLDSGRKFDSLCPLVEAHVEGGKYIATIPLGSDVNPDDLKISVKEHVMTIEVKREKKSKNGNSRVYQEFTRKLTLPEKAEVNNLKSVLTPEGYLQIEAPHPIEAIDEAQAKKQGLNAEDYVEVEVPLQEEGPPDEVEIPIEISSDAKPTGCVNN